MTSAMVSAIRRSRVVVLSGAGALQLLSNAAAAATATAVLGPAERGLMVLALTTASIIAVISVLGAGPTLRARLPTALDSAERRRLICAFSWITVGGAAVAGAASYFTSTLSAGIIDPGLASGLLPLGAATFGVGQVLLLQTTEMWFADGEFRRGGLAAAGIAAGGLLGLLFTTTVSTHAGALLLGQSGGQVAVGLLVIHRLWLSGLVVTTRPELPVVGTLIVRGAPTLGMTLGLAIALRADRYVLGITAGTAAVGIYSLAATLSETVRLLPQAIGQVFMRAAATGAGPRRLAARCAQACTASAAAAVVIATVALLVVVPLFGSAFGDARQLVVPLVIAEIALAPYLVASRGVLGRGWSGTAAAVGVVASGVAVLLYALGAGFGGSYGLALACVAVYGFLSVAASGAFLWKWNRPELVRSGRGKESARP